VSCRRACRRQRLLIGALAAGALAALALAGCGLAVGSAPSAVQLLVTRDFGAGVLRRTDGLRASEGETVLSLLAAEGTVRTSAGGRSVASIDGLSAGSSAGASASAQGTEAARWVFYVNGVQATRPALTRVHPGDHVWWDLHDASQSPRTPAAVVGAFPQPFLNGIDGKRLPVRVECATVSHACAAVTASLRHFGVPAAIDAVGSGGAPETLRAIVGPWQRIGGDLEAQSIARGPQASGVYARFASGGGALVLLDAQGQPVRTLGAGAGLIAATQSPKEAPVWVITGTDGAGVEAAARAFDQRTLEHRFAVALRAGVAIALPATRSPAL
jgi:hypothetical protein